MPHVPNLSKRKFSAAAMRTLRWCARTGAAVYWPGPGSAWTDDEYRWPVPSITLQGLIRRGALEPHPQQRNHGILYRVPAEIAAALNQST